MCYRYKNIYTQTVTAEYNKKLIYRSNNVYAVDDVFRYRNILNNKEKINRRTPKQSYLEVFRLIGYEKILQKRTLKANFSYQLCFHSDIRTFRINQQNVS